MATLDVSEAFDLSFLSKFSVIRRKEIIDSHGRSITTEQIIDNIDGVITAASPGDLRRVPDYDYQARAYTIYTQYRLQSAHPGYKNDLVIIDGDRYQVVNQLPYHNYGRGFVSVVVIAEPGIPAEVM
jgi:hypothetical protein